MGTYKVIQDIEAEDKLLGPLTLKQFIFAIIVMVSLFLAFRLALINPLLAIPLLPHTLVFGFLAAPFRKDQPNEIWLAAKIRFMIKPRRRIWDQSGIKELVTITVPKKIDKPLTKGFSQTEVKSRLKALANTIDSRGWAVKNVNVNLFAQPAYAGVDTSDRLVGPSSLPQDVSNADVSLVDDMFDDRNNPRAQQLSQMISAKSQTRRQQLVSQMQQTTAAPTQQGNPVNYWFMNEPPAPDAHGNTTGFGTVVAPGAGSSTSGVTTKTPEEETLLRKIQADQSKPTANYSHMRTILPLSQQKAQPPKPAKPHATRTKTQPASSSVTAPPDPAILELANNDDLNVATIARQANKKAGQGTDEVVISLH